MPHLCDQMTSRAVVLLRLAQLLGNAVKLLHDLIVLLLHLSQSNLVFLT
jgi:hypothetical protein